MIRTDRLSKRYGATLALDGVDLSIRTGRALGLVGTNASGRTTLLDALATLVRPTSGGARVSGHDIIAEPLQVRRSIGYVRQSVSFHDQLTVREYLEFVAESRDDATRHIAQRIPLVLEQCDLRADWSIGSMSRGLRQRLAIASAVLPDPAVLLLDHPCNHLDPVARQRSLALFGEHRRSGATLIIAGDSWAELQGLCDDVAFMHRGSLLDLRTIDEVDQELSVTLTRLIAEHGRTDQAITPGLAGKGIAV